MANIDVDLFLHMVDLLEKYFPFGHKLVNLLEVPKNMRGLAQTIFDQMTSLKKITVFGGSQDIQKLVDDKYLPDHYKNKTA